MSLRAMHESKQSNLVSKPNTPVPSELQENLLRRAEEALTALKQEQAMRVQAEQEAAREAEKNRTLQRLLSELSEASDNEMPIRLSEMLKEQEKQLSSEKKRSEQLEKKLQDATAITEHAKKQLNGQIAQLESEIAELKRKLEFEKFDKAVYLKGIESREQALEIREQTIKTERASLASLIQSKAQELERAVIADYEAQKIRCEAEQERLIEQQRAVEAERQTWLQTEKEKIDAEVSRKVDEHKVRLDNQATKERAEYEQQHNERERKLENEWRTKKIAIKSKYIALSGLAITFALICGLVAIPSGFIAMMHGLFPCLIEDGKEIWNWFAGNCGAIATKSALICPILQMALPFVLTFILVIWVLSDEDEVENRKWVFLADKTSIIVSGFGVGFPTAFGKQMSILGLNTVMFPLAVYLIYAMIRWFWEIGLIPGLLDWTKEIGEAIANGWHEMESNQKWGIIITMTGLIAGIGMVIGWFKW